MAVIMCKSFWPLRPFHHRKAAAYTIRLGLTHCGRYNVQIFLAPKAVCHRHGGGVCRLFCCPVPLGCRPYFKGQLFRQLPSAPSVFLFCRRQWLGGATWGSSSRWTPSYVTISPTAHHSSWRRTPFAAI